MENTAASVLWRQLGVGLALLVLAGICYVAIARNSLLQADMGPDPGPAFLPNILIALLALGGLIHTVRYAYLLASRRQFSARPTLRPARVAVPVALILSLVLYAWVIPRIGYLASTLIFALIWLPLIEWVIERSRPVPRKVLWCFVEAVLLVLALYGIFRFGIQVPLP